MQKGCLKLQHICYPVQIMQQLGVTRTDSPSHYLNQYRKSRYLSRPFP